MIDIRIVLNLILSLIVIILVFFGGSNGNDAGGKRLR